ncbi:hypothetical protein C4D60_Mb01t23650 [Musa balbisiana]|uniref:Uncharacterized protein n=1 Tax=Musa balbisiana TaxID=52838 RepID=A0A4S8JPR2_MUSBA|nr:hypothetical protein C4D60_Mb01t23650 [Musa balbisiana]
MPHRVLVPLMTQGHMIPRADLPLLLADRGVLVSFITTPCNAARIKDTIHRARDSGLPIRFVELPFPGAEEGLAEGWENIDDLPRAELYINFFRATYLLQQPLELYLQGQQQPYPSVIISDFCHPWTLKVARNLRIPRITFSSMSCFALLCNFNIWRYKVSDRIAEEHQPFTVPGLREQIEVTRAQASEFFPGPVFENIAKDVREAEFAADGIVVNSFQDSNMYSSRGNRRPWGR